MAASMGPYNGHSGEKRDRVLRWINKQYELGTIPRPSRCICCGQTRGTIHAHHEDYDRPGSHVELCITCHLVLHSRFRSPRIFDEYRARVAAGWQAPALTQKAAFGALQRTILGGRWPEGHQVRTVVKTTFLDTLGGQSRLPFPED